MVCYTFTMNQNNTTQKAKITRSNAPYIVKGEVLNPDGRPKGSYSLKRKIIELLKERPDLEERLIEDLLSREQGLIIQMIDGRPKQDTEITLSEPPKPILQLEG